MTYEAQIVDIDSLQALATQGLLEGALIYNLKFDKHCVLKKKIKVNFGTASHRLRGLLDCVHVDIWGPTKTSSLGGHRYSLFLVHDSSRSY